MSGREDAMAPTPSPGRVKAFRVIAWIMGVSAVLFGAGTAVFGLVDEAQEIHAFHNAVVASLLLVLSAPPAIAAARAPARAAGPLAHLAALGVAGLATMVLGLVIDVYTLPFIVLVGVLLWLRVPPQPALGQGRPSIALGALVVVAAVPLVAYALGQAELQRIDTSSEHAELNHWVEMSFYAVAIPLLGALAALRPAAFRLSAWSAGVALAVMGAASLAFQRYPSAPDRAWGWTALTGSVVFLVVTEWEARRARPRARGESQGRSRVA